ncbi:MAG: tetratricopeptide repeat protein [Puniceicoccaceae bacterium]
MSKNPTSKDTFRVQSSQSAWFGFATRELQSNRKVRIRIRWGRIVAVMCILGIGLWFAKSWALYYFFKEVRNFEDVAFVDMIVFPANRSGVRIQQGNYQVEQAKLAMEREDYRRAYGLLREGVARSPDNIEGRRLLARIYAGWRPDLAAQLLVEGIETGKSDEDYTKLMTMLLLGQKEDATMLELSGELLLDETLTPEVRQILSVARLQSAILTGQFDIVRQLFEETDLEMTLDGVILGTQLYTRTGQHDKAIGVLLSALKVISEDKADPLLNQLVGTYKMSEDYNRARELALNMVIKEPLEWSPRVQLIDILSVSEMTERRDREIANLLKEHRNDEQAMIALAQLCADYGNVEAAARLYEIALENGYSLSLFSLTLAEAFTQAGEHQQAIDLCNELVREDPEWILTSEGSFNAIRALAYYGAGDTELGSLYLRNFIDSRRTNPNQLYQAARRFRDADRPSEAMIVLLEAYARDPKNEQVLAALVDVEIELGIFFSINEHLRALFDLRRPLYAMLESIHDRLQSDRFLFTEERNQLLSELRTIIDEQSDMDWEIWEPATEADS